MIEGRPDSAVVLGVPEGGSDCFSVGEADGDWLGSELAVAEGWPDELALGTEECAIEGAALGSALGLALAETDGC